MARHPPAPSAAANARRKSPKITTTVSPEAGHVLNQAKAAYPGVPLSVLLSRLILSGSTDAQ